MAIVSRFTVDQAVSVKKAVKRGLTQRLRDRVGMGDSDSNSSLSSSDSEDEGETSGAGKRSPVLRRIPFSRKSTKDEGDSSDNADTLRGDGHIESETDDAATAGASSKRPRFKVGRGRHKKRVRDIEMGAIESGESAVEEVDKSAKVRMGNLALPRGTTRGRACRARGS